ncbi:MAG: hypothetical protein US71_C0004G0043 [Parcubacteria group bacterium GW2011_GWD2_38_12]|nr:MAG: hypothetical protein US06_C0015G0003 [Parcubacteria group bacterium GW2011_GWC2_36_17]KKQ42832.1 MAG: hypothetical protein US61_C0020G0017 [Parcubacteria group bacterium GW2011_GWE2_37_8]KKQ52318.1 MAG: hypothetical protein US71_C0004G0043 [Parcubacteria group bacterium GW2011_GWD2_38_12]KKQ58603.1 MAG: hypothetical protein US79_C0005G0055 [Parcubacteria group bacterium GW2011_GWC1_38_17]
MNQIRPLEKIAQILRTKEEVILDMEEKMEKITGKRNILEKIISENDMYVNLILKELHIHKNPTASEVQNALIHKFKKDDQKLYEIFRKPDGATEEGSKTLLNFTKELAQIPDLFVLKEEVAREIIKKNPPPNIMSALGYATVQELLMKENFYQLYCSLRFIETNEWMHKNFDVAYSDLRVGDFEYRPVKLMVLDQKWLKIAEKFMKKKYHNVSHLKELGVIFVIPLNIDTSGETLRLFGLLLHYFHEVDFYSRLFKKYSTRPDFIEKMKSLLRGDVLEGKSMDPAKANWLIVQRYLAKDNENDPRLFLPRINSEVIHWEKAETDIARFAHRFYEYDLTFWANLDFVGDVFRENGLGKQLIGFNMLDVTMGLVMEKQDIKYMYHQQEAMWSKIFFEYMGGMDRAEEMVIENFDKGYISL